MTNSPARSFIVTIINPERLPEANRRWHRMACACKGEIETCEAGQPLRGDEETEA